MAETIAFWVGMLLGSGTVILGIIVGRRTTMAEYIIKDKVEWYKCKADITIGDKDFGNTRCCLMKKNEWR